ncbi:hypothetical protein HK096_009169, partial [Nowakowskiella sp. JEL0078]
KVTKGVKPLALQKIQDPETRAFIELCIQFDPKLRPQAGELLRHPFLTNTDINPLSVENSTNIPVNVLQNSNQKPSYANIVMSNSQQTPFIKTGSSYSSNSEISLTPTSATTHLIGLGDSEILLDALIKNEVSQKPEQFQQSEKPDFVESDSHTYQIATTTLEWRAICAVDVVEPLNPSSEDVKLHPGMETSDNEVMLRMVYGVAGGRSKEIKFPFNMDEDKSQDVVAEMVRESLINQEDQNIAWKCVEDAVTSVRRKKSNSSSIQDAPLNLQPQLTRLNQLPEVNENYSQNTESIDVLQLDKSLLRSSSAGSLGYDVTMYDTSQSSTQLYQRTQTNATYIGTSVTSSISSSSRPLTPNNNPPTQNQPTSISKAVSPPFSKTSQWNPNSSTPDVNPTRNFERNSLDEERTQRYTNQQQPNSGVQLQFSNQYSSLPVTRVPSESSIPPSYLPPEMNQTSFRSSEVGGTRISPQLNPMNSNNYNEGKKLTTNSPPPLQQQKEVQLSKNSSLQPVNPQLDVNQHPAMAQLLSEQQQQQIKLQQQIMLEQEQHQSILETQKLAIQNQKQIHLSNFSHSQPPFE